MLSLLIQVLIVSTGTVCVLPRPKKKIQMSKVHDPLWSKVHDPLWIAYSNIYVFMIVFILSVWTGSENVAIVCFLKWKRIWKCICITRCITRALAQALNAFFLRFVSRKALESFFRSMIALSNERQFSKLV